MTYLDALNAIALTGGAWGLYKLSQVGSREADLPPGPPTIPLLGNLHLLPKFDLHYKFTEWAKEYGEIYSIKLGPKTAIVLTSADAVRDLIEKKSVVTSDRPQNHMVDLISDGRNIVFAHYGETWKKLRRAAHEILTPQACNEHLLIQQAEATQLMHDLLTQPEGFFNAIRRFSASVIISVLFGKRAPRFSTPEVTAFFHIEHEFEQIITPGAQPPVDLLPILQYVPEMFAGWKTECKRVKKLQQSLYFELLEGVENRIARGEANGCFMETVCAKAEEWGMEKELIANLGGVLVDAGSDTTSAFMQSLVLALVAYPEVQKRAQREIDELVGLDRVPTLHDVDQLPYVQAIIRETHRFRPVAPLNIPHASSADITYGNYRIPAGTIIFMNIWGMSHDERIYENESVFDPDRYLKTKFGTRSEVADECKDWKEDAAFGSGRRICPGLHLAKNAIAMNTVNFLWGFNFGKARDAKTGAEVEPDLWDYAKSLAPYPNPFKCTITPRSARHAELIEQQFAEATSAFVPFEHELSEDDRKFVESQRSAL